MRTLLLALLALTVATAADAQTTPAKKPVSKTKTAVRRPVRTRRPTPRPAPAAAKNTTIAPPANAPTSGAGQGAYAAPGMPINPNSGRNVGDYNSSKPTPKPGSTLGSGKR